MEYSAVMKNNEAVLCAFCALARKDFQDIFLNMKKDNSIDMLFLFFK
jgi:hypothetical protein